MYLQWEQLKYFCFMYGLNVYLVHQKNQSYKRHKDTVQMTLGMLRKVTEKVAMV